MVQNDSHHVVSDHVMESCRLHLLLGSDDAAALHYLGAVVAIMVPIAALLVAAPDGAAFHAHNVVCRVLLPYAVSDAPVSSCVCTQVPEHPCSAPGNPFSSPQATQSPRMRVYVRNDLFTCIETQA